MVAEEASEEGVLARAHTCRHAWSGETGVVTHSGRSGRLVWMLRRPPGAIGNLLVADHVKRVWVVSRKPGPPVADVLVVLLRFGLHLSTLINTT